MDCRVTIAQTNPRLGDLHKNLEDHLAVIESARTQGTDLVVFPELSLTGYFLKDQVFELGLELESEVLARLLDRSKDISIGVGFVERTPSGQLFNSFAFLERGEILGVHRKVHLVSYGMFDEARDFAAGEEFRLFESRHGRFGPLICEDLWHAPSPYIHFLNDADALLVPSASPARGVEQSEPGLGSVRTWNTLLSACALLYRTWVLYAGRVGWEDGIGFGGASTVIDPFGQLHSQLPGLEPGRLEARIDRSSLHRARISTPLRRDEKPWILAAALADHVPLLEKLVGERGRDAAVMKPETASELDLQPELVTELLVSFLREEVGVAGMDRGLLGLSGGIDSAVAAHLCALAFGSDKVLGVLMPYRTSLSSSEDHALLVAENLGIPHRTIDISAMVDGYLEQQEVVDPGRRGNVMARARMVVLYDLSVEWGGLVIGTSNKTEMLLGYSTQWGDAAHAVNPLGDLYKHQVYQLARFLCVPEPVIEKPPSADLFEGQTNESDLGFSYADADRLLHAMVDLRMRRDELIRAGFEERLLNRVVSRVVSNQFKRQPPLIAKLSERTINHDFRYLRDWKR